GRPERNERPQREAAGPRALQLQRAADRLDALAHADQTEPEPGATRVHAHAVILDRRDDGRAGLRRAVRLATDADGDVRRLRMARDVGQALLHQAIQRQAPHLVELLERRVYGQLERQPWQATAPLGNAMFERRGQAQLVEAHRPQLADQADHHGLHAIQSADDLRGGARQGRLERAAAVAHADGVDLHRVEVLAELVVQVARQRAPLGLLDFEVLARQAAVGGERTAQLLFGALPLAEFAARLAIAARCEPRHTYRDHQQDGGQLVELKALEGLRPAQQRFADVESGTDRHGDDRDREDQHEIAAPSDGGRQGRRRPAGRGLAHAPSITDSGHSEQPRRAPPAAAARRFGGGSGGLAEGLVQRLHLTGVAQRITRQRGDGGMELGAAHDGEHVLHGAVLEGLLAAHEQVVLGDQPHEVQVKLARRGLDAEADIGHAARHVGGYGRVRELDPLVAIDEGRIEPALRQQPVEQQARAGVRIAVHEAHRRVEQLLEAGDAQRVAALDHETHLARDEADDAVLARYEPLLRGGDRIGAQLALRQVHAGELAGAVRERHQRVLVADIAQIDRDTGVAA